METRFLEANGGKHSTSSQDLYSRTTTEQQTTTELKVVVRDLEVARSDAFVAEKMDLKMQRNITELHLRSESTL